MKLNHFSPMNFRFSDIFRGYRNAVCLGPITCKITFTEGERIYAYSPQGQQGCAFVFIAVVVKCYHQLK